MNPRLGWVVGGVAAVVAALIFVGYFVARPGGSQGPSSLVGSTAPSFPVTDLSGKPAQLSQYRGRLVVMNLWASWCPPCRAEMPDLERFYRARRAAGVVVLGIDQGEATARAAAFARSLGITYPILVDQQQRYGGVYAALGLPTTVVVGRDGVVLRGFDGPLTYDELQTAVAPLIGSR